MEQTINDRVTVVEAEGRDMRDDIAQIKIDVRAIRDIMLTDTGERKWTWKTITFTGAFLVGFATFWHSFGDTLKKFSPRLRFVVD